MFNRGSNIPAVGASGAISGVLGGYLLLFPQNRVRVLTAAVSPLSLPSWFSDSGSSSSSSTAWERSRARLKRAGRGLHGAHRRFRCRHRAGQADGDASACAGVRFVWAFRAWRSRMPAQPRRPDDSRTSRRVSDVMTGFIEGEAGATRKVVAAITDPDYKPDPKSRSAGELAKHLVMADMWFADSIAAGPSSGPASRRPRPS